MQHLASDVNLICKNPSLLNNSSSVRTFTSFHNCLRNFIVSLLKSSLIDMLLPFSLFAFCRVFALSLYLRILHIMHIIVRELFPLFVLFCLRDVWRARSISIGHSKPSFSENTCRSFSLQSSYVSSGVSKIPSILRLFLPELSSRCIWFCST